MNSCNRFFAPLYRVLFLTLLLVLALGLSPHESLAQDPAETPKAGDLSGAPAGKDDLGKMSSKLNNPLSDIWALFTEVDWNFKKGNITDGSYEKEYSMIFQPVMPFPLTEKWKLITRPIVPMTSTKIPEPRATGDIDFDRKTGLGDIKLPLILTPKEESKWMFGLGPTLSFPTGTEYELTSGTWDAGPAAVLVHKTKITTLGAFGQYWWDYGGWRDEGVSNGSLLYFGWYSLPDQWEVDTSNTITYNDKVPSDSKWNVPVGLTVGKMVRIEKMPVKFRFGVYYSPVREDNYGQRWQFTLDIIPVVKSLVSKPLFD